MQRRSCSRSSTKQENKKANESCEKVELWQRELDEKAAEYSADVEGTRQELRDVDERLEALAPAAKEK